MPCSDVESVYGAFRARGSRPNVPVVHRWRAERRSSAHRPPGHTYLFCDRALGQIEANAALASAPEALNSDPYGAGWMWKMKPANAADLDGLLDAAGYSATLG